MRYLRFAINQCKCGFSRVVVFSFRVHWHLSDFQILNQSACLHISQGGFKLRLFEIRFLDTDHKETMGADDTEQTLKWFGAKMPGSKSSCRENRSVAICDRIQ